MDWPPGADERARGVDGGAGHAGLRRPRRIGQSAAPTLDDRVDELNRSLLAAVLAPRQPLDQLAWVVHLHDAGRQLERAADHAVDIAEQVWFLVTGELTEFDRAPRVPIPAS